MTLAELLQELREIGYPIAYAKFNSEPSPPYLVYSFAYSNDLIADNINYSEIGNYQIELYTTQKDLVAEGKVQEKLKELGIPYSKVEAYLDPEKLHQVIYEIQIIGG